MLSLKKTKLKTKEYAVFFLNGSNTENLLQDDGGLWSKTDLNLK
jgi:hypothetical protein